jgi:hypothetical protein
VLPTSECEVLRLWEHYSTDDRLFDAAWAIVTFFYMYYSYAEVSKLREKGWTEYWKDPFNYFMVLNIIFYFIFGCCKLASTSLLPDDICVDCHDVFIDFRPAVAFHRMGSAMQALNIFLCW